MNAVAMILRIHAGGKKMSHPDIITDTHRIFMIRKSEILCIFLNAMNPSTEAEEITCAFPT